MKRYRVLVSSLIGLLIILLTHVGTVSAHPLDAFVQATYITLTQDSVLVDVDLTPGILITDQVIPLMDPDGDQVISEAEGAHYAEEVKAALRVAVNDQAIALTLTSLHYPAYLDLTAGVAPIQLHFRAPLSTTTSGTYQLSFENDYAPANVTSTYLVNGFVQKDVQDAIDITKQDRDWYQRSSVITYTIGTGADVSTSVEATGQNAALQEQLLGFLHAGDD